MSADWFMALSDAGPERAAVPAIPFHPTYQQWYGPGVSNQPSHEVLLRESRGVPALAERAIANRIASLNPLVKESTRDTEGTLKDEVLDDHPLKVLLDRPHPTFTRSMLFRLSAQWIVSVGEAYWLKVGNDLNVPTELHPIPPTRIEPSVVDGVVVGYWCEDGDGNRIYLEADTVVRFFFPDPEYPWKSEGYLGPIGTTADAHKFSGEQLRSFYEHDATPKTALKAGGDALVWTKEEKARFEAAWRKAYDQRQGDAQGVPAMMPPGFDLVQLAMQTGADVTPLLEYWRDELLMNYGVPRSVLGQVVSGDRSSAETNQFVMDLHTITPITTMMQETLTLQLAPDFDEGLFVEFEQFVAPDKVFQLEQEKSDLDRKVKSINLVRESREDDPVPWGDEPVGRVGESPYRPEEFDGIDDEPDDPDALGDDGSGEPMELEPEPEEERARKAKRRDPLEMAFEREMRAIMEKQRKVALKRSKQVPQRAYQRISVADIFDPEEWRRLFRVRLEPLYRSIMERGAVDAVQAVAPDSGAVFIFNQSVVNRVAEEGAALVTRTGRTTQRRLARAIAEGVAEGEAISQIQARISKVFAGRKRDARTIARTEVLKANQAAQIEGARQSGVVTHKVWNTSEDADVRDTHTPMNGARVGLNEDFRVPAPEGAVGVELASAPGDPRLSAGNVINCRCFVTFETD